MLDTLSRLKKRLPSPVAHFVRCVGTAVVTPLRFSIATGHAKSSLWAKAVTKESSPIPWYTYPAIDFLAARDFTKCTVLEFGGGQSTLWWQGRAKFVVTIEEDEAWAANLKAAIGSNVELFHCPANTETRDISTVERIIRDRPPFDVIVIDGHLRFELAQVADRYLAPGGVIILDNAEGYDFYDATKNKPFSRVDFFGFAPGVSKRHATSILFQSDCPIFASHIPIANIEYL